ncbi:hypothetical protein ABPG74_014664 [Tetrahymena malaccensis]
MEQSQTEKIKFYCYDHEGYEIISILVSDDANPNKRLCCQKCMIYTYRGLSTDQFILLEDLIQGKEQATSYFLPIKKRELDIIQEAIIKSQDNGYIRAVEDYFCDLQKKINQKIHDKKKEALLKAEQKQNLIEDLRESFNRSEEVKEFQNLLIDSFKSSANVFNISEKINQFLEKHKKIQNEAETKYLTQQANNPINNANIEIAEGGEQQQQQQDQQEELQQQENEQNQNENQNQMSMQTSESIDFYAKFKNFRKQDFQIKVMPLEINIIPVYELYIQFIKTSNNDLVLGKNEQGYAFIKNNGGQTSNCRSDYIINQEKTHVFTFEFSTKPSDYMRIGIAKKTEDPEDKLCQCFGWSNNFDLVVERGENLSNLMGPNSILKMEVNIKQDILKFYDQEMKNMSKKKSTFTLDQNGEYNIVVYFHSDLKTPITLTLLSAELMD